MTHQLPVAGVVEAGDRWAVLGSRTLTLEARLIGILVSRTFSAKRRARKSFEALFRPPRRQSIALDLAGDEPVSRESVYEASSRARWEGWRITVHAGEAAVRKASTVIRELEPNASSGHGA